MDEWPRRSLTVARPTPLSSRRDAWLWRTVWRLAPLGNPSIRQNLETVPDYSRSIPRQTTALGNDPSESFPPSCFFVGSLSVWWRVGTLAAAAASPQAKPPAGVVAAPGCSPTPARAPFLMASFVPWRAAQRFASARPPEFSAARRTATRGERSSPFPVPLQQCHRRAGPLPKIRVPWHRRYNPVHQFLPQLRPVLVEWIDVPHHALSEHAVLVQCHQRAQDLRSQLVGQNRIARPVPFEGPVRLPNRCRVPERQRLALREEVGHEQIMMPPQLVERFAETDEVERHQFRPLCIKR